MWWHTRRNQIRSSSETEESIYIGGGVSSVEYWLSCSAGRGRTIVVTLDGLFRVKLKTAATLSIRLFPLHFSSRASPCAIRFRFHSTTRVFHNSGCTPSFVITIVTMAIESVLTVVILHFKKYHLRKRYIFSQNLLTDFISDPKI